MFPLHFPRNILFRFIKFLVTTEKYKPVGFFYLILLHPFKPMAVLFFAKLTSYRNGNMKCDLQCKAPMLQHHRHDGFASVIQTLKLCFSHPTVKYSTIKECRRGNGQSSTDYIWRQNYIA